MAATADRDALRFPASLSDRIAHELEAIAWTETDLPGDIPRDDPDAMYLAAHYADLAADTWEARNDLPREYLPHRIVDTARQALILRIEAEIARREDLVRAEYERRRRAGLIDANGVGDVPNYYELAEGEDRKTGPESDQPGWLHPEVSHMATIARSDIIRAWHFECPECGMTDAELGQADSHVLLCEVCLEDNNYVRLKRWPVDEDLSALAARRAA